MGSFTTTSLLCCPHSMWLRCHSLNEQLVLGNDLWMKKTLRAGRHVFGDACRKFLPYSASLLMNRTLSRMFRSCTYRLLCTLVYIHSLCHSVGLDIVVVIVSCFGLDSLGLNPAGRWDFLHLSIQALGPTHPIQCVKFLSGDIAAGAWHWHPVSRAIHLLPFWAFTACSRLKFTFTFYFMQ